MLWGACGAAGTARPLGPLRPWRQALGELRRHCPPPDPVALGDLLEGRPHPETTLAASSRRNRAVAQWLVTAARERPLVVVLDDLHRADPASIEMLRDVLVVARAAGGPPITVVTASRGPVPPWNPVPPQNPVPPRNSVPPRNPVYDLLSGLARYDLVRIHLRGLETEAVRALASDLGTRVDERTAHRLVERTGGNPLFLREILKLHARNRDRVPDSVPETVSELVHRRLAVLGPRVVEVLRIAALIGRDFDPALVAEIAGDPVCHSDRDSVGHSAYDALDLAAQARLIVPRAGRMAFAYDLLREAVLGRIPPSRAAEIHHAVMVSLSSRPGAEVAVIARHAVKAGRSAHREPVRWAGAGAGAV